jgi:polyisoprenoid-binding protein YceI
MKKTLICTLFLAMLAGSVSAQRYYTKSGRIEFTSKAPLEDITARNKTVSVLLDTKTGDVQFSVLQKSFEFEKALMQEHFNTDYVESDKFPKAEFKGTITNNASINYGKPGSYPATVKGKLTIHGVTRDIFTTGTVKTDGRSPELVASFTVAVADYKIVVPSIVKDKVAKTVKIDVDGRLEELK